MNTEFYKQMLSIKRERGFSSRGLAKECGLSFGTMIEFFDVKRPFRPLRDITMGKIHRALGIEYEVMEKYNEQIMKERGN